MVPPVRGPQDRIPEVAPHALRLGPLDRQEHRHGLPGLLECVAAGMGGEPAGLAVAFLSPHHAEALGTLADEIPLRGLAPHVLRATGESIIGEDREVEESAAISL